MAIVTFYNCDPKDAPKTTMPCHLGANAILTWNGKLLLEKRRDSDIWGLVGGGCKKTETGRQAIARELFEETGIKAEEAEFELIGSDRDRNTHYDFYCIKRTTPLTQIVLLPGETDGVQWASMEQVRNMVKSREICKIIGNQFYRHEGLLLQRQSAQE